MESIQVVKYTKIFLKMPEMRYIYPNMFKNINLIFYTNGVTEIKNLDHTIEISVKKYLNSQIFMKGTQKMSAISSHPTVSRVNARLDTKISLV